MSIFKNIKQVENFIEKYEKYYFKDTYCQNKKLGLSGIRTSCMEYEKNIMVDLRNGDLSECDIAWKAGMYDGRMEYSHIQYRRNTIKAKEYIERINNAKTCINKTIDEIDKSMEIKNYKIMLMKLIELFEVLRGENGEGIGSVFAINSMFFLSKGKIPIYDAFAYKAVRALYLDKNPKDISNSYIQDKEDSSGAMIHLMSYMWLLDEVFGKYKITKSMKDKDYECDGYISRGLDRALWVYGHATEKHNIEE